MFYLCSKSKFAGVLFFLFSLGICSYSVSAENKELPVLQTKTKDVFVFKNGLGYFVQQGKTNLNDGWTITNISPHATLGTYWIGSPDKETKVEKVVGFNSLSGKTMPAISVDEILKANIGKFAYIYYSSDKEKPVGGKIYAVPEDRETESISIDNNPYNTYRYPMNTPTPVNAHASLLLLDVEGKIQALNRNQIDKIIFDKNDPPNTQIPNDSKLKRVKIKVEGNKKEAELGISFLSKGIGWMPSYIVDISNPDKAKVIFKATLINDAEDLENTDLHFAVGYPNFIYSDILSPMTLTESLNQFMTALSRMTQTQKDQYAGAYQIVAQNVAYYNEGYSSSPSLDYGYASGSGIQGSAEEDLFFYDIKGINLQKGERAEYPFFTASVDYKHIYEWTIPDLIQVDVYGYKQNYNQQKPQKEQVWHSIKLFNTTDYPWTTAPALALQNGKPLAQDVIKYTSHSANNNLKLTIATDVKTDRVEEELSREHNVNINDSRFDKVTIKGELTVKNLKSKEVQMEINKNIVGNILEVSHDGKIVKKVEGLRSINNTSNITWQIPLQPGEEKVLSYKYEVYIR